MNLQLSKKQQRESFEYQGYFFELFSKNRRDIAWAVRKQHSDGTLSFVKWMRLPITTRQIAVVKSFDYRLGD